MLDPRAQVVTLMTMHASKGLEFPVVFVAGCEDGIVPYSFRSSGSGLPTGGQDAGVTGGTPVPPESLSRDDELDEERRLLYVAMTRCKQDLFLTRCPVRVLHGTAVKSTISPFVKTISADLCEYLNPLRRKRRNSGPTQSEMFS